MLSKLIEFRPGNKVYFAENKQIVTIYAERIYYTVDENLFNNEEQEVQLWGIPLTSDILEKCGFKLTISKEERANKLEDYYELRGIKIFNDNSCNKTEVPILYLHQLQNLWFVVTGTEIKI